MKSTAVWMEYKHLLSSPKKDAFFSLKTRGSEMGSIRIKTFFRNAFSIKENTSSRRYSHIYGKAQNQLPHGEQPGVSRG